MKKVNMNVIVTILVAYTISFNSSSPIHLNVDLK
ncbi:hypothetical protein J2Z32_002815 [Paenibacillus turicensis]|uniref:Uncharacterized protein n=1 Tax=Paenibacillus turicensis TaxID=160487 RepID=A0ABS4FUB0_9BACL|nr:hypothetical protein [Paenibacillus turicensis]